VKKIVFTLLIVMNVISSYTQSPQNINLKKSANIDSLYLVEMLSRRLIDDFTDEIRIDAPVLGTPMCTIHIMKIIAKNNAYYLMGLMNRSLNSSSIREGVFILFTDGTKLTKTDLEVNIDLDTSSDRDGDYSERLKSDYKYIYTAAIPLTPTDLKILSSKTITKFRLSTSEATVKPIDAEQFRIYSKNIIYTK
jgi:hypothetical protein